MVIFMLSNVAHLEVVTPPNPIIFSNLTSIPVNLNQNVCYNCTFHNFLVVQTHSVSIYTMVPQTKMGGPQTKI